MEVKSLKVSNSQWQNHFILEARSHRGCFFQLFLNRQVLVKGRLVGQWEGDFPNLPQCAPCFHHVKNWVSVLRPCFDWSYNKTTTRCLALGNCVHLCNSYKGKTAPEMHIASRIFVHFCPMLSIGVNCCQLLSLVVNCCQLLSIIVHCCPLSSIVVIYMLLWYPQWILS